MQVKVGVLGLDQGKIRMTNKTLWKSSKVTAATAPRTREARALQASPTKSGTLKRRPRSFGSSGTSKCLQGKCPQVSPTPECSHPGP